MVTFGCWNTAISGFISDSSKNPASEISAGHQNHGGCDIPPGVAGDEVESMFRSRNGMTSRKVFKTTDIDL